MTTFKELGVNDALCEAIERVNWKHPTEIQKQAIPVALEGRDIIGLAKTGSGKTGAFAIPILQALMVNPQPFFALIISPTRELAIQIQNEFTGLGKAIGVKCATLIGGLYEKSQTEALAKKPHIVIATPGRLIKLIETAKGFNEQTLRGLKYLVMDEADRMLSSQFERDLTKILYALPRSRNTYLFSATNTDKVNKLQRASMTNPVKISVNEKYADSDLLKEYLLVTPHEYQNAYLVWILKELTGKVDERTSLPIPSFEYLLGNSTVSNTTDNKVPIAKSIIVFVQTKLESNMLAYFLKMLGLNALPINSDMTQEQRTATIHKMKMNKIDIMIATDVAARGLDIPSVDAVIHYDLPESAKTYTHRTGRTARAGRKGVGIVLVNQYNAQSWVLVEEKLQRKLTPFIDESQSRYLETEAIIDLPNIKQCYLEAELGIKTMTAGKAKKRPFNLTDSMKSLDKKRKKMSKK